MLTQWYALKMGAVYSDRRENLESACALFTRSVDSNYDGTESANRDPTLRRVFWKTHFRLPKIRPET